MKDFASDRTSANTLAIDESPFIETNGLLFYKACKTPQFLNSSFVTKLFGEAVVVDHFVLLFSNLASLTDYAHALIEYGAQIIEGPGQWPHDFCPNQDPLPDDISMYFLSALMPSGGIIVLAAPHAPNDQLDRLLQERGLNAVHHVALRINDIDRAAEVWRKKGFIPLSATPQNDGCLCQWLFSNRAGQMVELICRQCGGGATFSCQNIAGLRLSEEEVEKVQLRGDRPSPHSAVTQQNRYFVPEKQKIDTQALRDKATAEQWRAA
jgi:hypothetical protein